MIEKILGAWRACQFDFRSIAYPADPLQALFPDWVDYYRLKSAIATVLQPNTILEIGVRYGYSYAAFKNGWPKAHYLGIDLDVDSFGGTTGAIDWARAMGEAAGDEFMVANTQLMDRLPGDVYDLIHIDGQQDGMGSYHDLSMAISQGRWLLVDGYLWTAENCQSISEFIFRHPDTIESAAIIPGYAGELLIKVDPDFLKREQERRIEQAGSQGEVSGSRAVRGHYTEKYFRADCGGWDSFRQHKGERLTDERLRSLLDLAVASRPKRLLDLGCGRGEIVYHAARRGIDVTAVDYSPAALEIARSCFEHSDRAVQARAEWICASAADITLEGEYNVVVAGDLVERMAPEELERMYAIVSRHLAPGGRFIVHTFPNAWFYRYDYPRRRRIAASVGAFLPREPRSRYEKLMHINEQSPAGLRRQLSRHFKEVLLWFLNPQAPAGSLTQPMTRRELAACRDLYAIASHEPIDRNSVIDILSMRALAPEEAALVSLEVITCPDEAIVGEEITVEAVLHNRSAVVLHSRAPFPILCSYHWKDETGRKMLVQEGMRTQITPASLSGSSETQRIAVVAPAQPGLFMLEITLVQESIRWFEDVAAGCAGRRTVRIKPL